MGLGEDAVNLWLRNPGSDLADWWDKHKKESERALDDFVDAHPDLWGLAAFTGFAMDLGAGMVDLARFGEGAAEAKETGRIAPLLHDVLRGVGIGSSAAGGLQKARPVVGKWMGLYRDTGEGGVCVPISLKNALQRTGQRFWLSLEEIGEASGAPIARIWKDGMSGAEMVSALRKLGAKFEFITGASKFEKLVEQAGKADGVITLPLTTPPILVKGKIVVLGHMALLQRIGKRVQIIDRKGVFDSLEALSKVYNTVWKVAPSGALLIKNVSARFLKGVATLMISSNAIVVKPQGVTVQALEEKFQEFKKNQGGPKPVASAKTLVVSVAKGDSLSAIAAKHYGSVEYWPLLWDANRAIVGRDPNRIAPGMQLKVPPFSSFSVAQREEARRRFGSWRR